MHDSFRLDQGRAAERRAERRAALLPVDAVLSPLLASDADVLADVGCGHGFFTIPAALKLGRGKVLAVDTDAKALAETEKRAAEAGLTNVQTILSEPYRIPVRDGAASAALLATVLHEVADKGRFLAEVRRLLGPGGRLAVVEFRKEFDGAGSDGRCDAGRFGPPAAERLSADETERLLREAGFAPAGTRLLSEAFYLTMASTPR